MKLIELVLQRGNVKETTAMATILGRVGLRVNTILTDIAKEKRFLYEARQANKDK